MKAIIVVGMLLLASCTALTGAVTQEQELKIGYIGSMTGSAGQYGQLAMNGIALAADELNGEGQRLRIIVEDDACDPKRAVTAARKLIEQDGIAALIGPTCSSSAMAVAPVAEAAGIVMLTPVASAPDLRTAGDYIFRNSMSAEVHGANIAEFAREQGASTAAILYVNLDNGIGYRDAFAAEFERLGGSVVAAESHEKDESDVRTQLTKIAQHDPDVLFIAGQVHIGSIVKQVREYGMEADVLGIVAMETPELIEVAGPAADGVFYSYFAFDPDDPGISAYAGAYRERYGEDSEWIAANAYDAAKLLELAFRRCGQDPACAKDALYRVRNYPGAGGATTFDADGEVDKDLAVKTVRDGKFVMYEG